MKKIIGLILIIFSTLSAQALSIQGVLRNDDGSTVADGQRNFTFSVYTASDASQNVWYETKTLNVVNGVYSHTLGTVTSMSGLDFGQNYWLGISIDGATELTPRTKLTLTPYAILAQVDGQDNVFPQSGDVGIGTTNPNAKLQISTEGGTNNSLKLEHLGSNLIVRPVSDGGTSTVIENTAGNLSINPSGGNVGIGTTNPQMPFQINSTDVDFYNWTGYPGNIDLFIPTDFDYNWSDMSGSSTHAANAFFSSNSDPSSGTDIAGAIGFGSKNSYGGYHVMYSRIGGQRLGNFYGGLQFQTMHNNNDGQLRTDMVIKNGLVGIGTDSPSEKLHVSGNVMMGNDGMLSMYNIASGYGSETLALQTTIDGRTVSDGLPYGDEYRYILALQPEYGYVGIGTATPTKLLTIDANGHSNPIRIEGSNASNAEANTELDNAPHETLLFGGIYTSNIYFYWKDHLGNKYMTYVAGSSLNGRSDMGEEPEDPTTVQLNEQAERIALLETELAEIKELLKSK